MKRTPKEAAMGAVMDEHSNIRHYIAQLERGEVRKSDGTEFSTAERAALIARLRGLQDENRAAYNWLRRVSEAGEQSSLPELGVSCLDKLRALLARLGIATTPSLEEFGATLEANMLVLVGAVNQFMDDAAGTSLASEPNPQSAAPASSGDSARAQAVAKCKPLDSEQKQ
ncbi:hypothetical protein WT83_27410 [Burkholderia territorii]|uniref:Uncharacterized protein n=1 Tax=Burkholderia territorii TaxID=1503055 RepID=A0A108E820_9BURK|nr:hypothetical protein [Burkholderia territorii]KWN06413.1 hypothetical protein WT83_27410 [Burkholderia territorii]